MIVKDPTKHFGNVTAVHSVSFSIEEGELGENPVAVYLTDGYGCFPRERPLIPVLWVVTPGGLSSEDFPFGEVIRLVNH